VTYKPDLDGADEPSC